MKSFYGIAFGIVLLTLCFSGCTGVNNWWKREHALKPLKEQYWNGELSYPEYRVKKEAVIAQLERTNYKTPEEVKAALREAKGDSHTINTEAEDIAENKSDAVQLAVDDKMIKDYEEESFAPPAPPPPPPGASQIDYGMLSRSIKSSSEPQDTVIIIEATPVPATTSVTTSTKELVTDSDEVKWTKGHDGVVSYEEPTTDALKEQVVQDGSTPTPPPVVEVPVEDATVTPADEAKAEPERAQEAPVIMDLGEISE